MDPCLLFQIFGDLVSHKYSLSRKLPPPLTGRICNFHDLVVGSNGRYEPSPHPSRASLWTGTGDKIRNMSPVVLKSVDKEGT